MSAIDLAKKIAARINPNVRKVADEYATSKGFSLNHEVRAAVDESRAAKIAEEYGKLKHTPDDPATKSAYDALINETKDQWRAIKKSGLKVTPIETGAPNPYKSSAELAHDVAENNHMYYYPTEQGFGSSKADNTHPLLQNSGEKINGKDVPANDIFRIVHDYMGHAKEGFQFGPKGEENAFQHHMQMYSPEAQKALASETRGQNSYVNFGPDSAHNRANPANTKYADQKAGILPPWARETEGNATHFGASDIKDLDPAFQGTGVDERKFLKTGKPQTPYSSVYLDGARPEPLVKQSAQAKYRANVDQSKLYDIEADSKGFMKQARADMVSGNYTGNPTDFQDLARTRIKEAGFDGIHRPDMQSAELFNKVPVSRSKIAALAGLTLAGALTAGSPDEAEAAPKSKIVSGALAKLEQLLPHTGNVAADDAARAALRKSPDKYEQYLKTLDESYGSQSERAKSLGFGDETYYHGTTSDSPIEKFKSNKAKSGQVYGRGNYVTDNPETADVYTQKLNHDNGVPLEDDSGSIYPVKIRASNTFGADKNANFGTKEKLEDLLLSNGGDLPKNWNKIDKESRLKDALVGKVGATDYSKALVDSGYDSVHGYAPGEINIINAKNLRSTNAAFDPRFKNSADLLAGKGMVIGGGNGALGGSYEEANGFPASEWNKSVLAQPDNSWNWKDYINAALGHNKNLPDDINQANTQERADELGNAGLSGGINSVGKILGPSMVSKIVSRMKTNPAPQFGKVSLTEAPQLAQESPFGKTTLAPVQEPRFGKTTAQPAPQEPQNGNVSVKPTMQELVEQRTRVEQFHRAQQIMQQRQLQVEAKAAAQVESAQARQSAQQRMADSAQEQEHLLTLQSVQVQPGSTH